MLKVLVTEDEEGPRRATTSGLRSVGMEADEAINGAEGLAKLRQADKEKVPFDALLVDLNMPVMDGWKLLEEIRGEHDALCRIIYTGTYDAVSYVIRGLELGVSYYTVGGQIKFNDLVALIRAGVAQKRANAWKLRAFSTLDIQWVAQGIVDILSDTLASSNVFLATGNATAEGFSVLRETRDPSGGRLVPRTKPLDRLLESGRMAVVSGNEHGGALQEFGSREPECSQLWVRSVRAPGGELLGFVGLENRKEQSIPPCYRSVIDDMCLIAGTALAAIAEAHRKAEVARREAEAQNKLLLRMNLELSHWLNSPLQVVSYAVDAVAEDAKETELSQHAGFQGHLGDIRDAVSELKAIQRRWKSYEEAASLELEEIDLSALVTDNCREYGPRVAEQGIKLSPNVENGIKIEGDRQRLRYLLRCLLDNAVDAIQCRSAGALPGRIEVSLTKDLAASRTVLRVVDNGVGIREDLREHLFLPLFSTKEDPLKQAHGAKKDPSEETHGMGLFSARDTAIKHGGNLVLEATKPGEGSTFALYLPLAGPTTSI